MHGVQSVTTSERTASDRAHPVTVFLVMKIVQFKEVEAPPLLLSRDSSPYLLRVVLFGIYGPYLHI
jgi:hypothetical protein